MTRDEIENMEAGKEMDVLVSEKVMGWHIASEHGREAWHNAGNRYQHLVSRYDGYEDEEDFNLINWHPSESIMWAFDVVESFGNYSVSRAWKIKDMEWKGYSCWVSGGKLGESALGETIPLAICRAALLARMATE